MPLITWGPQLHIGIDIIDRQHQRWVGLINDLDEAMREGRGGEVIGATLNELVDYTYTHFRTEEMLLTRHDYEDLADHEREHRTFTDQIDYYRDRFEAGAMDISPEVMAYLRDWLLKHITVSDRAYIDTLKKAGVE
jgi:hemerythrin-like metal-binding protein